LYPDYLSLLISLICTLFPVKAAYIRKLQQQADSIRQLLKLLNSTSSSSSQPAYSKGSSEDMAQGNSGRLDNRQEEEEEGYEQLWQLGTNCNGELRGRCMYFRQGCGSAFISPGSGTSILG
jgi:hypothetical protein